MRNDAEELLGFMILLTLVLFMFVVALFFASIPFAAIGAVLMLMANVFGAALDVTYINSAITGLGTIILISLLAMFSSR